jgi:hypothetical protein
MSTSDRTVTDLAAMAQGWIYALNTVTRPVAEHLEAAQAALKALESADGPGAWRDTALALAATLAAARARLAPRPPTIAELVAAVDQLRAAGLVSAAGPDPALAQAIRDDGAGDRIAELEAELEDVQAELEDVRSDAHTAEEKAQLATQRLSGAERRAAELDRQRQDAERRAQGAHAGHSAAVVVVRRQVRLDVLRALGFNPPGFADMPDEELEAELVKITRRVLAEAGSVPKIREHVLAAWRPLVDVLDAPAFALEDTAELARDAAERARRVRQIVAGLRRQIADQAAELAQLRQERSEPEVTVKSWNSQAETIRELRAELADRDRRIGRALASSDLTQLED